MKKITILAIMIVLMLTSFFTSWLFFMSSGMIDKDTWELDEWNTYQILRELDEIPLISLRTDDITFASHGTITEMTNHSLTLSSWKKNETFAYSGNLSDVEEGDRVLVHYTFSPDGEARVTRVRK